MRAIVILAVIAIAAPGYAEDPLETLHTVQDTIATMEQTIKQRMAAEQLPPSDRMHFTSAESPNASGRLPLPQRAPNVAGQDRKTKLRRPE